MTKVELIAETAAQTGQTKKATQETIGAMFEVLAADLVAGNKTVVQDFGKFEPVVRAAREGVNPKTKEKLDIPAKNSVRFQLGKGLKAQLNQ